MTTDTPETDVQEAPQVKDVTESEIKRKVEELEQKSSKAADDSEKGGAGDNDNEDENYDPYYPPVVSLPIVEVKSGEDGEVEVFKRRAKLYRYAVECDPPEWEERGTGDVRIMKKEDDNSARILMRREKTLKVCANHYITPWMDMKPNCGSQKAWVWKTQADFADEEVKQETLAIKFGNVENAKKFFEAFEEMRNYVLKMEAKKIKAAEEVARKETEANLSPPAAEGTKEEKESEKVIDEKMS